MPENLLPEYRSGVMPPQARERVAQVMIASSLIGTELAAVLLAEAGLKRVRRDEDNRMVLQLMRSQQLPTDTGLQALTDICDALAVEAEQNDTAVTIGTPRISLSTLDSNDTKLYRVYFPLQDEGTEVLERQFGVIERQKPDLVINHENWFKVNVVNTTHHDRAEDALQILQENLAGKQITAALAVPMIVPSNPRVRIRRI